MIHSIRWTARKIEQRLHLISARVYRSRQVLPPFRYQALPSPDPERQDRNTLPVGVEVDDTSWPVIEPNTYWGDWKADFVLRSLFEVPADWQVDEQNAPVALYLPLGEAGDFIHPEVLAYIDGKAYAAADRYHQEIRLKTAWQDGKGHTLALHGYTGMGTDAQKQLLMRECAVVQIDQATRDFIATVRVTLEAAKVMDERVPARGKLLHALDEAFKILDTREPDDESFYASVLPAHTALRTGIAQAGAPLDVNVVGTGHAHIDVAWLWTLGQTRRKAGRTFHTVHRLMEQFPKYHFTQSQPQLYEYVRQDYPELFEAIKERVAEERWELIGGMWVEADCNLTGPESLARQFLLGRSFFAEHFGPDAESPVLWLPDVFGYAWALPQLIKQAGLDYFFTIKIGWSQYNRFPYDSFWWQGIDGTRVLTHFSTTPDPGAYASTYNAMANPQELLGTWTNFKQKDLGRGDSTPPLLMAFGFGDGGGGPTREMLENIREMAAFPGLPQMSQKPVSEFFHDLETTTGDILPVWNGELYLEYHRGTYTTQSRNKRANRKSEFLLHDAEYLGVLASLLDQDYTYPAEELRHAWQLVCLNQFHDIIPGSSISEVYKDSERQYDDILQIGESTRTKALQTISAHVQGDVLLINPISFERDDLAFWPDSLPEGLHLVHAQSNEPVLAQATYGGTLLAAGPTASFGLAPLVFREGETNDPQTNLIAEPGLLENAYVRVELDGNGDITRIYDKREQREVLPEEAIANSFQAFEDRPVNWDAWDVDIFYDDKIWLAEPAHEIRLVEAGPLRATVEIKRTILHSSYTQRLSLSYNSPRLDIETRIGWRERHILLKVAFPVDILNPVATYEIQWGNVQRPTHHNTSWDWARFETCAQKWVDLSEGGYGVSILNDCKYGHDIRDNVIRISLLRSPTWPDPHADEGEHIFSYSILPHSGNWNEQTISAAYALNDPLLVYSRHEQAEQASGHEPLEALIRASSPNIVIETVKQAEDGNGIIVRLYESQRRRGSVTLTTGFPLQAVYHTNLLEQSERELMVNGTHVSFAVHPYEIVTLRLVPAQ